MNEMKLLLEIQSLDAQKRSLEMELEKLKEGETAGGLKALKIEIEEGRVLFIKLKGEYADNKKEIRSKEMDVAAANEQIKSLGQKLYGGAITNVKEINSSNKKLDNLKNQVQVTEDKILNIMEQQDHLRAKLEEMSVVLNEKLEDYKRRQEVHLGKRRKLQNLLKQIPLSREKLLGQLNPVLEKKYTSMKEKFADPLARVEKGICGGCRVGVPFNDMRLLKQGEGTVFCSYCGRMLYWEG